MFSRARRVAVAIVLTATFIGAAGGTAHAQSPAPPLTLDQLMTRIDAEVARTGKLTGYVDLNVAYDVEPRPSLLLRRAAHCSRSLCTVIDAVDVVGLAVLAVKWRGLAMQDPVDGNVCVRMQKKYNGTVTQDVAVGCGAAPPGHQRVWFSDNPAPLLIIAGTKLSDDASPSPPIRGVSCLSARLISGLSPSFWLQCAPG